MRTHRERSAETKRKISEGLKGKAKSDQHKQAISEGLRKYWATVPNENNELKDNNNEERKD